jgi:sec-independent protein translocase protein TatC
VSLSKPITDEKRPFAEHVHELRGRLFKVIATLIVASSAGYFIHEELLHILQKPLNQTLFYTSPTGGLNFVFKLCFLFGFVFTIPVLVYQISKFLAPVIKQKTNHMFVSLMCWSSILAASGIVFAYYVSLPGALKFLTNFGGKDIKSLITADEYFNFAVAYLLGYALLFQLPLIILFINRIKPLKPTKMLKAQRYIVLGSFVLATGRMATK